MDPGTNGMDCQRKMLRTSCQPRKGIARLSARTATRPRLAVSLPSAGRRGGEPRGRLQSRIRSAERLERCARSSRSRTIGEKRPAIPSHLFQIPMFRRYSWRRDANRMHRDFGHLSGNIINSSELHFESSGRSGGHRRKLLYNVQPCSQFYYAGE